MKKSFRNYDTLSLAFQNIILRIRQLTLFLFLLEAQLLIFPWCRFKPLEVAGISLYTERFWLTSRYICCSLLFSSLSEIFRLHNSLFQYAVNIHEKGNYPKLNVPFVPLGIEKLLLFTLMTSPYLLVCDLRAIRLSSQKGNSPFYTKTVQIHQPTWVYFTKNCTKKEYTNNIWLKY